MAYTAQAVERSYDVDVEIGRVSGPELTALPENKNIKRPAPKKAPYFKYAALCACVFAALMCILTSYNRVNELTTAAAALENQLIELESTANALNAKKEQRFNLAYVEDVAVNQLGMVKLDKNQITYVAISNPEKITVAANDTESTPGLVAGIVKSFNAVVEYLD